MQSKKEIEKYMASKYVVDNLIFDDLIVGVGTGTTINIFIELLSEKANTDDLNIICIPSSIETKLQLIQKGLVVSDIIENSEIDIYIDGADIVTEDYNLIKGGGGAMTMEKILASSSQEFVVIVDSGKYPKKLLSYPVPVEIIPLAVNTVIKPLFDLGGELKLRYGTGKIGPIVSDNGNVLGDVTFKKEYDPKIMEKAINNIPGIIENGLFPEKADKIVIGIDDSVKYIEIRRNKKNDYPT
ncbi:MAG: ribose-5-phosphate isomerase RpiA [Candidatus Heimdallarchaeum endolithica]|uniref:Ribose-5-phosphate isomerase A n=1 Tax=Candidatus Heimdallarchaeum endolithica TaxID=2876572 RepID=A0A9Y1BNW5_9ARCH|nr:MAG: ribose-5-phosphate isomerase RpiA [Candidatus Heimdallarchaeum endolithica]